MENRADPAAIQEFLNPHRRKRHAELHRILAGKNVTTGDAETFRAEMKQLIADQDAEDNEHERYA
jgi:hypothetical protein